ncbi:MAG: glycosyltransferase [Patescibacteria group bacterium]
MSFFLLSHVMFQKGVPIYGPVQVLERYLKEQRVSISTAYSPLFLEGKYIQTGKVNKKFSKHFSNMIVKYFFDVQFAFLFLLKNKPKKNDVVIAVDPLNCVSAVILRVLFRFTLIYYTADYSDSRFPSEIMNQIYHWLDQFCLNNSDQNWCVSDRIVEKRKQQRTKTPVHFVPNTPILPDEVSKTQKESSKNKLLYVGSMDQHMNVLTVLDAVKKLSKTNKRIQLTLIGGGLLEHQIKEQIKKEKMEKIVEYFGPQKNSIVIEQIKKSGIGLALYSGGKLWNKYGDSMKIREYQYFGLPVVTTEVPSNAKEVEKMDCGIVLTSKQLSAMVICSAVTKIQKNFLDYSKNTHLLMQQRQKHKILTDLLKPYLS